MIDPLVCEVPYGDDIESAVEGLVYPGGCDGT